MPFPNFVNGADIAGFISGNSYGYHSIVGQVTPEGNSYALKQTAGAGGEYEVQQTSFLSNFKPNTYYRMSAYVSNQAGFNASDMTNHSRWWTSTEAEAGTTGPHSVNKTIAAGGITWEQRVTIFQSGTTTNGNYSWYIGYPTGGTTGYRLIGDIKLEEVYR